MRTQKPSRFRRLLVGGLIAIFIGCNASENAYQAPPPPDVTVAQPVQQSITSFLEQNGVIEAVDEAEVRARVQGFLESVKFEPGQKVTQGEVLYQIESVQYQASVNSAKAEVSAAEASVGVATAAVKAAEAERQRTVQNLERAKKLLAKNAGSQAELDAAVAENDFALAAIESAKASVQAAIAEKGRSVASLAQAQIDLDYTTVRSPIDGRISATDVKLGNLVQNGAKLAVVVNRDKVFANFSISDREMLRYMRVQRAELKSDERLAEKDWSDSKVYLQREGDEGFPFAGVLNYVSQQGIDASTGTLGLRALFDNSDQRLFPGLFVTVRIPSQESIESMLIPEYAVLRDQKGSFVLTVNDEGIVDRAAISVAQTISGWVIVEKGLTIESRVVVDGLQRARPGLKVIPSDKKLEVNDQELLRGFLPSDLVSDVVDQSDASGSSQDE